MGATPTAQTSLTSPPGKAPEPARSGPLRYSLTHPNHLQSHAYRSASLLTLPVSLHPMDPQTQRLL